MPSEQSADATTRGPATRIVAYFAYSAVAVAVLALSFGGVWFLRTGRYLHTAAAAAGLLAMVFAASVVEFYMSDAGDGPSTDADDYDRQQRARADLEEWGDTATHLFYCDLCGQVFASFDMFYDHREASADERARRGDEEFLDYRELTSGDSLPDGATVGAAEPCQLTHRDGGDEA